MGTKVTLRKKKISNGRESLYLDFYPAINNPATGKPTRREFLGLYIFDKPKTPIEKKHNAETIKVAESIKQKRENILNKPEIYTEFEKKQLHIKEQGEKCFVKYFRELIKKRKGSNSGNWTSALNYLEAFTNGSIKFSELNEKFFNDFKDYLLTTKSQRSNKTNLSTNSAASYFMKIKAALKQAYADGLLQTDLNAKIQPIKSKETRREYLTIEELNKLVKTPCSNDILKRAALFSALTGLRFSDIQKMVWGEIEYIKGQGYFLNFRQKKTQGVETLPISEQAFDLLGERRGENEKVFAGLVYSAYTNEQLFQWIKEAGITKKITFHCFRHTFATLQMFYGTDIYTVSKMLGHREIKTTQIYAKVVDDAKREAANKIKLDID
ncbi:MAG: site-specific integrase [Paludibacteraceae bacterium]|nr:site-specific integrase [Paludibacteraceae bacterium]